MQKLNNIQKQQYFGGIAATSVFAIGAVIASGVSLISNIVSGALNVSNAAKAKPAVEPTYYNQTSQLQTYTQIF